MQDRSGKASDEEIDAHVASTPVVAKRRVSFALAVTVVLLCGGIGVAAGWMFPPQTLMTGGDSAGEKQIDAAAGKQIDDDAAHSATLDTTSAAPSTAVVVVEPPPPVDTSEAASTVAGAVGPPPQIDLPAPVTERAAVEQPQPRCRRLPLQRQRDGIRSRR